MITTILLLLILTLSIYNCYVHLGRNGRLINLIPGRPGHPVTGNFFQYWDHFSSREKLWKILIAIGKQYYPIFRVWGFFLSAVLIYHPDDLETILCSTKHIEKSLVYDVLHPWLGTGLLTSGVK